MLSFYDFITKNYRNASLKVDGDSIKIEIGNYEYIRPVFSGLVFSYVVFESDRK